MFHIGGITGRILRCGQIIRAFGLLVEQVVKNQRKFQEMDFSLEYKGVRIGGGAIFKISSVESRSGNGTDVMATS